MPSGLSMSTGVRGARQRQVRANLHFGKDVAAAEREWRRRNNTKRTAHRRGRWTDGSRGQMTRINFEGRGSSRHSSTSPLDGSQYPPTRNAARSSRRAVLTSAQSYMACAANPNVTPVDTGSILITKRTVMHVPANQPEFSDAVDPAVEELNRIVDQAESLLRSLGDEGGEAAEAVRERVTQTLNQAKAKLAATAERRRRGRRVARRSRRRLRAQRIPWQAIAIAALLGSVVTLLDHQVGRTVRDGSGRRDDRRANGSDADEPGTRRASCRCTCCACSRRAWMPPASRCSPRSSRSRRGCSSSCSPAARVLHRDLGRHRAAGDRVAAEPARAGAVGRGRRRSSIAARRLPSRCEAQGVDSREVGSLAWFLDSLQARSRSVVAQPGALAAAASRSRRNREPEPERSPPSDLAA